MEGRRREGLGVAEGRGEPDSCDQLADERELVGVHLRGDRLQHPELGRGEGECRRERTAQRRMACMTARRRSELEEHSIPSITLPAASLATVGVLLSLRWVLR